MPQHICQICHKNPATIHEFLVAEKKDNHLCEECYQKLHTEKPSPILQLELLQKLFQSGAWTGKAKVRKDLACASCGMTLSEFKRRGQLGCEGCYQTFRKPLESLLESIHDSVRHAGGRPPEKLRAGPSPVRLHQRLEHLRQDLEAAVKAEKYEDAAALRDEIRRLEQEGPETRPSPPLEER